MNNKQTLAALSMDLKRFAMAAHNKSHTTAHIFIREAMKRRGEVATAILPLYMKRIIERLDSVSEEDALMYSTRIQNYVLYK